MVSGKTPTDFHGSFSPFQFHSPSVFLSLIPVSTSTLVETVLKAAGCFPPVSLFDGMHRWLFFSLPLSTVPAEQ